jgi:hypothetical protein
MSQNNPLVLIGFYQNFNVNRGKVTSWRLLVSPSAVLSIITQVPHWFLKNSISYFKKRDFTFGEQQYKCNIFIILMEIVSIVKYW